MTKSRKYQIVGLTITFALLSGLVTPVKEAAAVQLDSPPMASPTNEIPDSVYEAPATPVAPIPVSEEVPPPPPGSPQEAEHIALEAAIDLEQSQIEASHTDIEVAPTPVAQELGEPVESGETGIDEFATSLDPRDGGVSPAAMGLQQNGGSSGCDPGPSALYNASVESITTLVSVTNNAAGSYSLRIRNTGTTAWPAGWLVASQILDSASQLYGGRGPSRVMSDQLLPNGVANATVTILPLAPGSWFASWEISVSPVGWLRERGVCSVSQLPVYNQVPSLTLLSPLEYGVVNTNRPFFNVSGVDRDGFPGGALTYKYTVCRNPELTTGCETSGWTTDTSWQPTQPLLWGGRYYWSATVSDGVSELSAFRSQLGGYAFTVVVPAADEWRQVGNGLGLANAFGLVLPYGVFVHTEREAQVEAANVPLFLERTFSSGALGAEGAFGNGWMSVLDAAYVRELNGLYRVTYPDGRQETFGQNPNGEFVGRPELGVTNRMAIAPNGALTVIQASGETLSFDSNGRLTKIDYPRLGSWDFTYLAGKVSSITQQPSGRKIEVEWALSGQTCSGSSRPTRPFVTAVSIDVAVGQPDARWSYRYSCKRLVGATDPLGNETTYGSSGTALNAISPTGVSIPGIVSDTGWTAYPYGAERRQIAVGEPGTMSRTISLFRGRLGANENDRLNYLNYLNSWGGFVASHCETRIEGTYEQCSSLPITMRFDELNRMRIRGWSAPEQANQANVERLWMYGQLDGRLNSMRDENGQGVSYQYDGWGNLTTTYMYRNDGSQVTSKNYYEPFDGPTSATRVTGSVVSPSQAHSAIYAGEFAYMYSYDSAGRLIKREGPPTEGAPLGEITTYSYTAPGSSGAIDGSGIPVAGQFAPAGLLLTETAGPQTVTNSYSAAGDLTRMAESDGSTTTQMFDSRGLIVSVTVKSSAGGAGATTRFERDPLGRVTKETGACATNAVTGERTQREVSFQFDDDGRPTSATERAKDCASGLDVEPARTTTTTYASRGQVKTQTNALGGVDTLTYSTLNPDQVTSIQDARGRLTRYTYTIQGNHISTVYADFPAVSGPSQVRVANYAYDNVGRLVGELDALSRHTAYQFTPDGHPYRAYRSGPDLQGAELWYRTLDGAGRVLSEVRGGLERTDYVYDSEGRLSSWTEDPLGVNRTHRISRDAFGRVIGNTVVGGGLEERTSYELDSSGAVITTSVHLSPSIQLKTLTARNSLGLVTSITDPRGQVPGSNPTMYRTTQTYDELNRPVAVIGAPIVIDSPVYSPPQGESSGETNYTGLVETTTRPVTELGYNAFGDITESRSPNGLITRFTYDRMSHLIKAQSTSYSEYGNAEIDVLTRSEYSAAGDLTRVIDSRGGVTDYTYDIAGNKIIERGPTVSGERPTTRSNFDAANQLRSTVSPTGAVVAFLYDVHGRVVTRVEQERNSGQPLQYRTTFTYDRVGNVLTTTSPGSRVTRFEYNGAGERIAMWQPGTANPTRYVYDLAGRVVKETDPSGRSVETTFDRAGRSAAVSIIGTDGARLTTSFTHDAAGNVLSTTNPRGVTTTFTVDAANRRKSIVEPVTSTASIRTEAGYDISGNVKRTRDGRGFDTWTEHNQWGLITRVVEPSTPTHPALRDRSWTYEYDNALNQTSETAPGGTLITREYDSLNRMTAERGHKVAPTDPAAASRTFTYDLSGNLAGASSGTNSQSFTWLDRGLLKASSGGRGSSTFGYDADGLMTQRATEMGATFISYNSAGKESSFTDQATAVSLTTSYSSASGEPTSQSWATGSTAVTFDPFGRLATSTTRNSSNDLLQQIAYGYDANSNVTSKTAQGATQSGGTYEYDLADRLIKWSPRSPDGSIGAIYPRQYQLDNNGNTRLEKTINIAQYRWTYDTRNRLTGSSVDFDGDDYAYPVTTSAAGQVTFLGDSNRNLTYDALGQLVGDKSTTYSYDGLGRLAQRTSGAVTQYLDYAGLEAEPYRAPSSSTTMETVGRSAAGQILSSSLGSRVAVADGHGDILGGVGTTGSTAGTLVSKTGYEPFGELWSGSASTSQGRSAFGFQGSWTDSSTGSVWMGTRWYDPEIGSFLSRDSTRFGFAGQSALNLYSYGHANPLKFNDPDGRFGQIVIAGVALTVGQVVALSALASFAVAALADYYSGGSLSSGMQAGFANAGRNIASNVDWAAHSINSGANSITRAVEQYLTRPVDLTSEAATKPGQCYVAAACDPFGPKLKPQPKPTQGTQSQSTGTSSVGKPTSNPAAGVTQFRPDTTINVAQAGPQLVNLIAAGAGVVASTAASVITGSLGCGLLGTLQSCVLPGSTITSNCAGSFSPAGLCGSVSPIPGGSAGSGSTAPVGPITTDPFTTTTSSTLALAIALSVGTPRPPDEPEDECVPEPEGGEYTQADLDAATDHLREWDALTKDEPGNLEMLRRIQSALDSGSPLTLGQSNFLLHELHERKVWDHGNAGLTKAQAHAGALELHKFGQNFDPDILETTEFGHAYDNAWC